MSAEAIEKAGDYGKQHVNPDVAKTLFELMGPEKFKDLVGKFKVNSDDHLSAIDHILANEQYADLKAPVHSLKGSSGNLGAMSLSDLCLQIETVIASDAVDVAQVKDLVAQVKQEYDAVLQELLDY